jgi:hypothetical protein
MVRNKNYLHFLITMTKFDVYLLDNFSKIMKKGLLFSLFLAFTTVSFAQLTYTMGYERADIDIIDKSFFSVYEFPGQPAQCGIYDNLSATFYTCDNKTYRYVDEDHIRPTEEMCCTNVDFDPSMYYGTLTFKGYIEHVEWDSMVVYFKADGARMRIEVDEREIDALYKKFYEKNYLGKVHMVLRLKTYDTPKEYQLSYNRNTEKKVEPVRIFTKILRW